MCLPRSTAVCFLAAALLIALPASAELVQVPNLPGFAPSSHVVPFGFDYPIRYQQIYAASAFPRGGTIDKVMFRNDEQNGKTYQPTPIDVQVSFAYAATPLRFPADLFQFNIGEDFTVVLDGFFTESYSGPLGQTEFDFVVDVANTFTYDPRRGDLLMEFRSRNSFGFYLTQFDFVAGSLNTVTNMIVGQGADSPIGLVNNGSGYQSGLITQFEFVQVPESSTLAMLGFAPLTFSGIRRGKRL